MEQKLLIIRLSSFGDIVQAIGVPAAFTKIFPNSQVHWVVRSDFFDILNEQRHIKKIWSYDRKTGLKGLWEMIQLLRKENFTHIYDAHDNIRSRIISAFLKTNYFIRRKKERFKRILLFVFRKNLFPQPFIAQASYIDPLLKWGIPNDIPAPPQIEIPQNVFDKIKSIIPFKGFIVLSPSAAWELKRWPINYWKRLIGIMPDQNFVVLGGPSDLFCSELILPGQENRIVNLAGRISFVESCSVIQNSKLVISNDTGLLHVADQMGVPTIALIGPTAFGYPSRTTSKVLEVQLPCKPCSKDGRGRCRNQMYKKCLREISVDRVKIAVLESI